MSRRPIAALLAMLLIAGCAQGVAQQAAPLPDGAATSSADPEVAPTRLGLTPADERVEFRLSLNLGDEAGLDAFLAGVNDPTSRHYQRFLSAADFGERFGLPQEQVARVVDWLESAGLDASAVPQRTSVAVSGSAARVNAALGVTLVDWTSVDGERYHEPDRAPTVPAELRTEVATVLGLDSEPVLRPAFTGVSPGGLLPSSVSTAYEIDPLHDQGLHGEGQVVAIVSFDTFTPSDVDLFDQREGIDGPPVEIVRVPGTPTEIGPGTGEVALDIQVIRGIAPQARLINYEGPNTQDGFAAIIARIVADGDAQIASISWGLCEKYSVGDAIRAEQREFAAAFAAGISIFVASGDDGAYGCRRVQISNNPFERDLSQSASWPATSPSAISVGGTFLSVREDGSYVSETGWEEPLSGAGGGGGLSKFMDRPSWQVGDGVDNSQSDGSRQVPDVAGPADPSSGFYVVYTEVGNQLVSGQVGGTSAAAPFWAASMALTRQLAGQQGIDSLGALGPTLYAISGEQPTGAVFHDVIRGGNLLHEAAPGWDYSTGLGSPRVAPLANAIVEYLSR